MQFTTWYAVYYIMKKGLKTGTITQWEKAGEIPEECIESPDTNPRGGYMPLGLTGYICPLMAKEGEKALVYTNTGKYYFVDALTERLLAYYCYVDPDFDKTKRLFEWKNIKVKTDKDLRQIRKNFTKTHKRVVKPLTKSDIPIYADETHDFDAGVFAEEHVCKHNSNYTEWVKVRHTCTREEEKWILWYVKRANSLFKDCDFGYLPIHKSIFLHAHGIDTRKRRVFPRPFYVWLFFYFCIILLLGCIVGFIGSLCAASVTGFVATVFGGTILFMGLCDYIKYYDLFEPNEYEEYRDLL